MVFIDLINAGAKLVNHLMLKNVKLTHIDAKNASV